MHAMVSGFVCSFTLFVAAICLMNFYFNKTFRKGFQVYYLPPKCILVCCGKKKIFFCILIGISSFFSHAYVCK